MGGRALGFQRCGVVFGEGRVADEDDVLAKPVGARGGEFCADQKAGEARFGVAGVSVVQQLVGARQGWVEAPYGTVPCKPHGQPFARPDTRDPRIDVRVIPGLKQTDNPDVMRGEETQIAGLLKAKPNFDGVACLPGTHTKWVHISAGEVVSFRTFMTGELFGLIAKNSVLRHSIGSGWHDETFTKAVTDTLSRPEAMAANLFSIRADQLLNATDPGTAKARLSGLLIGAELAAARPYWLGQNIVLIGDETLSKHYATALKTQGAPAHIADATQTTLAGLASARALTQEPAE